jgi:hypothetical protein
MIIAVDDSVLQAHASAASPEPEPEPVSVQVDMMEGCSVNDSGAVHERWPGL